MTQPIDPPVDWHTEPAGKRFDTVIAAKLGYTDLAISNGLLWGTKNGEQWCLPEYSTDTDAALHHLFDTLPDDCTPRLVRILHPMGDHMSHVWKAAIIIDRLSVETEADAPSMAICLTWLAWKERDGS